MPCWTHNYRRGLLGSNGVFRTGDILESCISSFKGYIEEHGYGSFDLEESFLHHNSVGVNLENLLSDTLKDLKFKETVKRSSEKILEQRSCCPQEHGLIQQQTSI